VSPTYFAASFRPHPGGQAFPNSSERLTGEEFYCQTPGIILHHPSTNPTHCLPKLPRFSPKNRPSRFNLSNTLQRAEESDNSKLSLPGDGGAKTMVAGKFVPPYLIELAFRYAGTAAEADWASMPDGPAHLISS
jgi:hypothetical protein